MRVKGSRDRGCLLIVVETGFSPRPEGVSKRGRTDIIVSRSNFVHAGLQEW